MLPTENELKLSIKEAVRKTVTQLFKEIDEDFYYLILVTTGEAHVPFLSAWSWEALNRYTDEEIQTIKWSYADSPYYLYGENFFQKVKELFQQRPAMTTDMSDKEWEDEFNLRINAMETALKELDEENVFDRTVRRRNMIINVEVTPPDYTNTHRAIRLNPKEILKNWLAECAEDE